MTSLARASAPAGKKALNAKVSYLIQGPRLYKKVVIIFSGRLLWAKVYNSSLMMRMPVQLINDIHQQNLSEVKIFRCSSAAIKMPTSLPHNNLIDRKPVSGNICSRYFASLPPFRIALITYAIIADKCQVVAGVFVPND